MKSGAFRPQATVLTHQDRVDLRYNLLVAPLQIMQSPELQSHSRSLATRWFEVFLLGLILLGIGCRFYGLNWDDGAALHPDERFVAGLVERIGWPTSPSLWFDSERSPFNPANLENTHFVYGQWPLLAAKSVFLLVQWAALSLNKSVPTVFIVGRALSAFIDVLTIGLTFLVARRVMPRAWALFAAALVALAALHVQQSHFFTVDNFAAFWMLASFWGAARWQTGGKARDALLAGACLGVAMACKISAVFIAVPLLILLLCGLKKHPARQLFAGALSCIVMALVCFRVFQPMAFVGEFGFLDVRPEARFWNDLAFQAAITRGEVDIPFNVQWVGRAPWLFSARNLGFWGYGWGLLISGALGLMLALIGLRKRDQRTPVVLASALFCLIFFGVQGATFSKFTRYFLPMTPFVALLAAYAWQWLVARRRWLRFGAPLVAAFSALWCGAVSSIYGRPHTRLEASKWIVTNIAPGTVTANETLWDEGLPLSWLDSGTGNLEGLLLDTYAGDTVDKREKMLEVLNRSDWIFISSGRSWQNIPRWPAKWPMMSRFYYALWSGELGFEHAREFTSYPQLGPLQFPDDEAEEALSVYDHPRVILWKKGPNYSALKARQILEVAPLPTPREWQPRRASN